MNINASEIETLDAWLVYIESLHQEEIKFGLERVRIVFSHLFPQGLASKVITVGGTNGKGTTCSYIESILLCAGYTCGKNTSPHISLFNERIAVNGALSSDEAISSAFQKVELSRSATQTKLTYFEFTFLASLVVFENAGVDFAICEVGMGGRLDAVNILSPEISVITTIDLDHIEWLGDSREKIALEKVAISRPEKPCIIGELDFPASAKTYISDNNVDAYLRGKDFAVDVSSDGSWSLSILGDNSLGVKEYKCLPKLNAPHLYQNAACAVMAVSLINDINFEVGNISEGLRSSFLSGRCQLLSTCPFVVLDVAHNVESVRALAAYVRTLDIKGNIIAVCSMLQDKDVEKSLALMGGIVNEWYVAPLETSRSATSDDLELVIQSFAPSAIVKKTERIEVAYEEAKKHLLDDDCLVVFGSFFVVGDILRAHSRVNIQS